AAGPPADVFALGAILFEALAGRPAFEGDNALEVMRKIEDSSHGELRRLARDIPADLVAAVEKALERDPAARHRDGLALAAALVEGKPVGRKPPFVAAGVGLLVLGGLGAGLALARRGPAPPSAPSPSPAPAAGPAPAPVVSHTSNPEALRLARRALERYAQSDNDGALADATKALELEPRIQKMWAVRGTIRIDRKDHEGAISDFEHAVALDPKDGLSWGSLAAALHDMRQFDRAVSAANKAIENGDPLPMSFVVRAEGHKRKGDAANAIADFTRALDRDGRCTAALIGRGFTRKATGDLVGARADLERFIELVPGDSDAGVARKALAELERTSGEVPSRAETLLEARDLDGTIEAANAELEFAPDSARALHARGVARMMKGTELEKALADLDRAIGIDAGRAETWVARAGLRLVREEFPLAIIDATRAIELDGRLSQPWITRAVAKERTGDTAGAIADFEQVLGRLPEGSENRATVEAMLAKVRGR
ncbi:MAG: tetratricopeptide repeat protein, partial [Planctomycetota bacterium]